MASSLEVDGRYSTWLHTIDGGWIRARKTDNTHLCPAGAAVLGAAVTVRALADVPPPPSGTGMDHRRRGPSDEARFGPPGDCPDDQPPPRTG